MSHVSALQFYGGRCLPKGPRSRPALAPARQHCRPCERELLSATPPRLSVPSVELVAPWRKSETLRRGCVLGLLPKCSTVLLPSSGSFRMSSLGRAGPWWPERRRKPRGGGGGWARPALRRARSAVQLPRVIPGFILRGFRLPAKGPDGLGAR